MFFEVLKRNRDLELMHLFNKVEQTVPIFRKYPTFSEKALKAVLSTKVTTAFVGLNNISYVHDLMKRDYRKYDVSQEAISTVFKIGTEHSEVVKDFIAQQFNKEKDAERKKEKSKDQERKKP